MRKFLLLVVLVACGLVAWQRWTISQLHETESRLRALPMGPNSEVPTKVADPANGEGNSASEPIPDSELPSILNTLRTLESTFERAGYYEKEIETFRRNRANLMSKLGRLTSNQAHALFEEWQGDDRDPRSHHSHVVSRAALIMGQVNPQAALELAARRPNGIGVFYDKIFSNFFLEDPVALRKWVEDWMRREKPSQTDKHGEAFTRDAAKWLSLARATEDPATGAREFARFAEDTASSYYTGLEELGQKLETNEERLTFLQNLHAATEGKVNIGAFLMGAAKRSSFAQISSLADQLPDFHPKVISDGFPRTGKPPTMRCGVASHSKDGTPKERWNWLVSQPENTPEGTALEDLVENWARDDDTGTAEWIATLSGPIRDAAEKSFVKWKRSNLPR